MRIDRRVQTFFVNREKAVARRIDQQRLREGQSKEHGAAGVYRSTDGAGGDGSDPPALVAIDLERLSGAPADALVTVIAHEYAHHALAHLPPRERSDEELADLLPVLFGFGLFSANSAFVYQTSGAQVGMMAWHSARTSTLGYLGEEVLAFTQAIVTSWKQEDQGPVRKSLKGSIRGVFSDTLRFLRANRLTYWEGAPGASERGTLARWFADQPVVQAKPQRQPVIKRVDVKWSGTFVGSFEGPGEDGFLEPECIDFGKQTAEIECRRDTVFGLAYRLASEDDALFAIEERLLQEPPKGTGRPARCRSIQAGPGELRYFLVQADDSLFARDGCWALELWCAGSRQLRRVFSVHH